jgi:hypothetical protein
MKVFVVMFLILPIVGILMVTAVSITSGKVAVQEQKLILEYGTPAEKVEVMQAITKSYKKHLEYNKYQEAEMESLSAAFKEPSAAELSLSHKKLAISLAVACLVLVSSLLMFHRVMMRNFIKKFSDEFCHGCTTEEVEGGGVRIVPKSEEIVQSETTQSSK